MTAQSSARELVTVAGRAIERLEYKGQPVVTLKMIDDIHGTTGSRMQFSRNKKHFEINVDFFVTNSYEAADMGFRAPNGINLITESGYLKLVKTFTDDLAWQVQGQLVECYFRVKHEIQQTPPSHPIRFWRCSP